MRNDDYIKRSDALLEILSIPKGNWSAKRFVNAIDAVPAADVEPVRHGHNMKWDYPSLFECSLCGWGCYDTFTSDTGNYQYCPNCGAKIDKEVER